MSLDVWGAAAVVVSLLLWVISSLARIDRTCTRFEGKLDGLTEWRKTATKQLAGHGTRLQRLEVGRQPG